MKLNRLWVVLLALVSITVATPLSALAKTTQSNAQQATDQKFEKFVEGLRQEARKKGISEKTINKYLTGLKAPRVQAIYNVHHQPQATISFEHYLKAFIPHSSVVKGRKYLKKYHTLLLQVQQRYHVQPRFIIALWGFESDFGRLTGDTPIVPSLVTLAFQHHRSQFYRAQVMAALKMLNHQVLPQQSIGMYDGGMGQPSFEPIAYLQYGVDFDHDGFANIWTSMPDVFASIANFLHQNGWNGKQTWGMEVKIPDNLPKNMIGRHKEYSIATWEAKGVHPLHGGQLPKINSKASLLLPSGPKGRAFLVFHNFKVLLRWNNTTFEGISVGLLSDQITHE